MLLEQNTVGRETLPNNPHPDLRAAAPRAPAIFTPMRCSRHIPLTRQTSPRLASWLFYPIQSIIKSHLAWCGAAPASCCARNFQLDQRQQNLTCRLWSTAADAGTWSQGENNKFIVQPPGNCDYYQQWVEILCNLLWRPHGGSWWPTCSIFFAQRSTSPPFDWGAQDNLFLKTSIADLVFCFNVKLFFFKIHILMGFCFVFSSRFNDIFLFFGGLFAKKEKNK